MQSNYLTWVVDHYQQISRKMGLLSFGMFPDPPCHLSGFGRGAGSLSNKFPKQFDYLF